MNAILYKKHFNAFCKKLGIQNIINVDRELLKFFIV